MSAAAIAWLIALVLGCALVVAVVAYALKGRAAKRANERLALAMAHRAADDIKRRADERKQEAARAAEHEQAAVPSKSNEELEKEMNK